MEIKQEYFQDFMHGNVCYGCGIDNKDGLQIKSFWDGEEAVCIFHSEEKYHGWANLLSGGILATIIDCHCMGTAMANAYKVENRPLDSEPHYRYATGTMNIKYLKPTPNTVVELRAKITQVKGKKTVMHCTSSVDGVITAEAEVIAIRVFDSNEAKGENPFKE
ncbi:PaaI family thioesterase [Sediminitomix flava]|uniref:Thioesterase superfamily protein n=1 Tax=Sediminitomix flava TaxID=379075 RepID=A0A315ZFN1_SEDFL|nr:PaaI family thioesterase [Sediminitomix flava]PWJ43950.1 hypothetical protein BC781_101300 [Sediminitomix flava]